MTPGDTLYQAATTALADAAVRAKVKQMYDDGYSLLQMVEALGLDDDMSARVKSIIEQIPDAVVAQIRQLTLAVIGGNGNVLPLDCTLSAPELETTDVAVSVQDVGGTQTIVVQAS